MDKKRGRGFTTSPQHIAVPFPYVHGSHLCVAHYPRFDCKNSGNPVIDNGIGC